VAHPIREQVIRQAGPPPAVPLSGRPAGAGALSLPPRAKAGEGRAICYPCLTGLQVLGWLASAATGIGEGLNWEAVIHCLNIGGVELEA